MPALSPNPQLFETQVKFLAPDSLTALIRFIGIPHIPKPPTKIVELSLISLVAYFGQENILENKIIQEMDNCYKEELITEDFNR